MDVPRRVSQTLDPGGRARPAEGRESHVGFDPTGARTAGRSGGLPTGLGDRRSRPATVPLADLGSLLLYATRHTRVLPNIAVVQRFAGGIPLAAIEAETRRIASNPYGLG